MNMTSFSENVRAGACAQRVYHHIKTLTVVQEGSRHTVVFTNIQILSIPVGGFFHAVRTTKTNVQALHLDAIVTCPMSVSASIVSKNGDI